jgi:tripartite-type tricarboxylate transporter receptor subunit TctC
MKKLGLCLVIAICVAAQAAHADDIADFYKGKNLTIVVGMAPPDQHDVDARMLARNMGKYIPGQPNIIVQNMPGAGSLKALQYLATVAAKDGLTIGIFQRGVVMMPLLGYPDASFDPTTFNFIGSRAPETSITVLWRDAKVKSVADAKQNVTLIASTGGGADSNTLPYLYNETLGTQFKVITGYAGAGEMNMAMERREVDGRAGWSMGALRGTHEDWYRDGRANIILQHALHPHRELKNVPLVQDLAKSPEDKALLDLFAKRQEIGFPVMAPAGVPPARIAALQAAYLKTMADPEYVKEAKMVQAEIDPVSGEQMSALIKDIYATAKPVVDRAKAILIAQGAPLK